MYVRRFRRAGSAGEFGAGGACRSRGPMACAVRFRACGREIRAASGLGGRYDISAQGVVCDSNCIFVGRAVKRRVETSRQHTGRGTGRGGAGLALLLACRGLSSVPAASCWRSQASRGLPWELHRAAVCRCVDLSARRLARRACALGNGPFAWLSVSEARWLRRPPEVRSTCFRPL